VTTLPSLSAQIYLRRVRSIPNGGVEMDRIKRVLAGLAACAAFMSVGAVGVAHADDGHTLPDGGYGHVVGGN